MQNIRPIACLVLILQPAAALAQERSQDCLTCISDSCSLELAETEDMTDPTFGDDVSGHSDALALIEECVRLGWLEQETASCAENNYSSSYNMQYGGMYSCYCGEQSAVSCVNNGPTGECAEVIHDAFMVDPVYSYPGQTEMQYVSSHWVSPENTAADVVSYLQCVAWSCEGYCYNVPE